MLQAGLYKARLLDWLGNLTAKFTYFLHSLDVRILISLKILHSVASEILVKFDIFDTPISSAKYFKISLNLGSKI